MEIRCFDNETLNGTSLPINAQVSKALTETAQTNPNTATLDGDIQSLTDSDNLAFPHSVFDYRYR